MVRRRAIYLLCIPLGLLLFGTVGYKIVEGDSWSWLDCLYMTSITLTTIGFMEVHPLSPAGRMFTIVLCLGGVSMLAYAFGEAIRFVVTGEMKRALGRQTMNRMLAEIGGHTIICGYGRVGQLVGRQFAKHGRPFVVIDANLDLLESDDEHFLYVHGNATSDDVLILAGVERAHSLVATTASDADNLYITLSARLLNPALLIVARCEDENSADKFRRVGANQVISPYVIGGLRIAQAVARPSVSDFVEKVTFAGPDQAMIEEVRLNSGCALVGKTLAELRLAQELGVTIVAIREVGGGFDTAPNGERILSTGETLIVFGPRPQLKELEKLAAGV